jgi:hypothetical protein
MNALTSAKGRDRGAIGVKPGKQKVEANQSVFIARKNAWRTESHGICVGYDGNHIVP